MTKHVILAAQLPATADRLYDMYLDAEVHSQFTKAAVTIEPMPGSAFTAFDGKLLGKMLHVEPKRLIVQTWRSAAWPADALDSILTLGERYWRGNWYPASGWFRRKKPEGPSGLYPCRGL